MLELDLVEKQKRYFLRMIGAIRIPTSTTPLLQGIDPSVTRDMEFRL